MRTGLPFTVPYVEPLIVRGVLAFIDVVLCELRCAAFDGLCRSRPALSVCVEQSVIQRVGPAESPYVERVIYLFAEYLFAFDRIAPPPVSCLALEARNTGLTLFAFPAFTNMDAVNPYSGSFVGERIALYDSFCLILRLVRQVLEHVYACLIEEVAGIHIVCNDLAACLVPALFILLFAVSV